MRIVGLTLLGLLLLWNVYRIINLIILLPRLTESGAAPGYVGSFVLSTIGFTALIAFAFFRLLKKTD